MEGFFLVIKQGTISLPVFIHFLHGAIIHTILLEKIWAVKMQGLFLPALYNFICHCGFFHAVQINIKERMEELLTCAMGLQLKLQLSVITG